VRWFLVAVALVAAAFSLRENATGSVVRVLPTLPLLPLSVGVAVLRYRLCGVDVAIRRSLVYGWLFAVGLAV